jgi:hypothetical protein
MLCQHLLAQPCRFDHAAYPAAVLGSAEDGGKHPIGWRKSGEYCAHISPDPVSFFYNCLLQASYKPLKALRLL